MPAKTQAALLLSKSGIPRDGAKSSNPYVEDGSGTKSALQSAKDAALQTKESITSLEFFFHSLNKEPLDARGESTVLLQRSNFFVLCIIY